MATVKANIALPKILKKLGVPDDLLQKINQTIADYEDEFDEIPLMTELEAERLLTPKLKPNIEEATRATILDFFDKNNEKYVALLPDDKKAEHDALKSTEQKTSFLMDYFQGRDVTDKEAKAIKKSFEEYRKEVAEKFVEKSKLTELQEKVSPAYKKAVEADLIKKALRHQGIAESAKNERRFETNFINDFNEVLKTNNWKLDYETGDILNNDGEKITDGSDILDINGVISKVVETFDDWQKKSSGSGSTAQVAVVGATDKKIDGATALNLARL